MAIAAAIERDQRSAEDERARCDQAMRVVSDADAKHICRGGARPRPSSFENAGRDKPCPYKLNNASATARSSLVVILMFIELPGTATMSTPSRSTRKLSSVT